MLLPAVCTMLTAIQTFPLDGLHPTAFGEGYNEYPVIVAADTSSKLGWNLNVQPQGGNRERPKIHTSAGITKRPSGKAARPDRFSYNDNPAWKMLLTDTSRFLDAIHKQVKPVNSTNEGAFKSNTRMADISLEFTLSNDLANSSEISLPKKRMHTSTATPSSEKETSQSIVEGTKRRLVPAGAAVLTHGRDRTMQAESNRLELGTSPLQSGNGKNVLASREPLSQLRQLGNKVILLEPSARTKGALPSPRAATTSPKRRRLPHSRQNTVKSTATMRPSEPSGATRTNKMRTAHASIHQVNNATEHGNGTGTMLKRGSFNSSKPRRLRRRKKRLKLNLFQPRRRKLTEVQKRSRVRKCLPVKVWQHTGHCEPEQRKLEDHMTESSVVRPRVYGVDPIIGSEEREQLTRQHAVKRARHVHLQPPEEPASQESQEDYYNYSPEYHDEEDYHQHHSYESPEDVNDEDFQEADHRERHLASPNVSPEKGSLPKIDANSTRAKSAAMDTEDDGKLMDETKHLNYSDISKDTVELASHNASSHMLNDTVEGFTLLIEDDRELTSIRLHQDPPNSTSFEDGLNHDPEEIKLSLTDPTPAAPSELAAMSGIQQVTRDADNIRKSVHGASSNRREDTRYSKFFSFAEVPALGQHRFGYRKGNDQHFTGRLELADGPHVKSVVVWADRKGGHGKHIWDYNHED